MNYGIRAFMACVALSCALAMGLAGCAQPQASQSQHGNARESLSATDAPASQANESTAEGQESSAASATGSAAGEASGSAAAEQPGGATSESAAAESNLASSTAAATSSAASESGAAETSASTAANDQAGTAETSASTLSAQSSEPEPAPEPQPAPAASADTLRASLNISEDYRASFDHGYKGPEFQRYIMLHDTEGDSSPWNVVDYWDSSGNLVASHFVVGKDGSIVQCVPLDRIAHHAGFGDAGHNDLYGVQDESRDDKLGTVPIGDWAPDYGMNSYSVGIEMVHVGGSGYYPEEQLQAVDALIAYIDAYYGFNSPIIDHKAWRSGNSDTSPEFAGYLANYQDHRTHL